MGRTRNSGRGEAISMNTHAAFFTRDRTANPWLDRMRELSPVISGRAAHWDRERTYCWSNIADLSGAGLMGMSIPRRFGGGGASFLQVAEVVEEAARHCTQNARVLEIGRGSCRGNVVI